MNHTITNGCYFCHVLKREYNPMERATAEEAKADWNAHVLANHGDMEWTQDNRASLVAAGLDTPDEQEMK